MKTIGKFLKDARAKKKYSKARVAKATKIKVSFIEAIEKENWEALPEFPVVLGFVKSIAGVLKVDKNQAVALLRRDYPPRVLPINPKPDVSSKFTWSPRLTFLTGLGLILVVIFGYLTIQYFHFVSPPKLTVESPKEGQVINKRNVSVSGKVDPEATLKINNQPVLVGEDGTFKAEIEIYGGTEEIVVKAVSRSGKETVVRRKIKPEL
jgi:cytoskeletal protein RodZ